MQNEDIITLKALIRDVNEKVRDLLIRVDKIENKIKNE